MTNLIFNQIEKRHGDRVLLNVESLRIAPGSCILITGDNGSGKSTLLKILSGLLAPDRCQVVLDGEPMTWRKARRMLLRRSVYVHQTPYMLDTTVAGNVAYGLRSEKLPRHQLEQKVADALRWANLDHLAYRNARMLSDGEKQQVAITRARVIEPEVLALDEPTANLDRRYRNQTYALVANLRDAGVSVLLASHDITPLSAICDQHWQLQAGRLTLWEQELDAGLRQTNIRPFPRRKI